MPHAGCRIARVEFNCPLEFSDPFRPFQIAKMQNAQCGMGLAEMSINFERLPRRRLGSGAGLRSRNHFPVCGGHIRGGQPRISERVVWVEPDRPLEVFDAFLNAFFGTFVPKEVAFHIKLISLEVVCIAVPRQLPLIASQLPYRRDEAITTPGYRL